MKYECPLIEISGKPHERGVQHGTQAKKQIAHGVGHYTRQLSDVGFSQARIHELARSYLPRMEEFEPDYVDEMRGIAQGSGFEVEDIAFLNARTEIVKLGTNPDLREHLDIKSDECTSALALPEATANGVMIIGQNWDWKVECAESTVVVRIRREDGPDVLTFTEAGGLARSGMNSAGIGVVSNYLDCERDYRELGIPLLLTRRKMLESTYLAEINRIVYSTRRSGSNNLMFGHAGGVGYDLECAPDEVFAIEPENGILTHANHWDSPTARAKLRDTGIANTPDTLVRGIRMGQILRAHHGQITRETFKTALLDDYQTPYSICRPPRKSVTMAASATVASIIMEPAAGVMEVSVLPALDAEYQTYRLDMEASAMGNAA